MRIYITGVSGTGKTSVARTLEARGINAIDLDEISHWENKVNKDKVEWEAGSGDEWMSEHDWVADLSKLKELLSKSENSVVVGHTANQDEYLPLFDKTFVLNCKPETVAHRINTRTDNDFGKHPDDLARILEWNKGFVSWMQEKGAEVIDGERSLEEITQEIIDILNKK